MLSQDKNQDRQEKKGSVSEVIDALCQNPNVLSMVVLTNGIDPKLDYCYMEPEEGMLCEWWELAPFNTHIVIALGQLPTDLEDGLTIIPSDKLVGTK